MMEFIAKNSTEKRRKVKQPDHLIENLSYGYGKFFRPVYMFGCISSFAYVLRES